MNICILTSYFFPEEFKVNDIAFDLVKKGYDVTVITAIPNYPKGVFFKGYTLFKRRKEVVNGVNVIRLPVIPRGNGRSVKLILNYFSYLLSSVFFVLFYRKKSKFDAIFVHQTSPFTIGVASVLLKKKQNIPMYFWVLDLWPESVKSAGGISNTFVLSMLNRMVVWVYNNSDKILISSKGFAKSICAKGDYDDKILYFPNWTEDVFSNTKEQLPLKNIFKSFSIEDFIILFTGNIGEAQNINAVLEASRLTMHNKNIKWVFVGDGRKLSYLQSLLEEYSLQETVFFAGRYPIETMPFFISNSNILLVSLKDEEIFNLTVPAKIQFYMYSGKPILAMIDGDGAELISDANCGFSVPAGDYTSLASKAIELFSYSDEYLKSIGKNGRIFYDKYFPKEQRIEQLIRILEREI